MNEHDTHTIQPKSEPVEASRIGSDTHSQPNSETKSFARQLPATAVIVVVLIVAGFLLTRKPSAGQSHTEAPPSDPTIVSVSDEGKGLADVKIGAATLERLDDDIKTTGLVTYPADSTVKIAPRVAGRVRQVFVKVGDRVAAGQELALLESSDVVAAESADRQAKATLAQAKLTLDRQERLFRLGTPDVTAAQAAKDEAVVAARAAKTTLDLTKTQDRIGGFTQKPLSDASGALIGAQSTLSQAQADLALAQKDYDRKKRLLEIGVASQVDMEQSQDAFDKAKVNVQADEEALKLAKQTLDRERQAYSANLYADQTVKQNEAAYVQSKLQEAAATRALELSKTQIRRDLEQARTDYANAMSAYDQADRALALLGHPAPDGTLAITSPVGGVVTERDVSPGQVVDQSTETPWQMFVVSNPDRVWVDGDAHEIDIARIGKGAPVTITAAGAPGRTFTGRVTEIAPTLDRTSHTVKVRAEIPNPNGTLRDGMYADVTIHVVGGREVVTIPLTAVSHEQDSDYVYVQDGDKYRRRLIKLGRAYGSKTVVTDGLKPGEPIVTHGALYLGSHVSDD